jgi:F420-dependent oxidoreductase-like protein
MIEVAIMIEGQNGLNWPRWQRMVNAVEDLGFVGLYRSDHYTNANPPDLVSLELWVSLTWLASHTDRIEFGPLVTPFSFRHPTMTARMAAAVDSLSGGRLILGVGAGWQEREHHNYGWDLLGPAERFDRFEEGVEVVHRLLRSDEAVDFDGEYYDLHDAIVLPGPSKPGRPRLLLGGNGMNRTLPLAARFADCWNGVFLTIDDWAKRNQRLDRLLAANNRAVGAVQRSLMTRAVFGRNKAEVQAKLAANESSADELRQRGIIVGTGPQIVDALSRLADVGVERIMLQWLDLDDLDGLEALAHAVLPHV